MSLARLLILLLGCLWIPLAAYADTKEQLQQVRSDLSSLKKLQTQYSGKHSKLEQQLGKAEKAIGRISRELKQVNQALASQKTKLVNLKTERKELQSAKLGQQQSLEQQIRSAYQLGQERKLKMLLNQEQPEQLGRLLAYYDYMNQARSDLLINYQKTLTRLDQIQPEIKDTAEKLEKNRVLLARQQKQLSSRQKERKTSLNKLNNQMSSGSSQIKSLEKQASKLKQLLDAVSETLSNLKLPTSYEQNFKWKKKNRH